jgi:hypothetical protein
MAEVSLSIAGRQYTVHCRDGEEPRLHLLARMIGERVDKVKQSSSCCSPRFCWRTTFPTRRRRPGRRCRPKTTTRRCWPRSKPWQKGWRQLDKGLRLRRTRPRLAGDGYCPVRAYANIPEAISHPRGLSLARLRPVLHGPHLTLRRQRIFQQTAMAVPSPSFSSRAERSGAGRTWTH